MPVTQADRENTANVYLNAEDGSWGRRIAVDIRAGRCDHLPSVQAAMFSRLAALDEAAEACEREANDFLSPEYATGQPISSIQERFACGSCRRAILRLKDKSDD